MSKRCIAKVTSNSFVLACLTLCLAGCTSTAKHATTKPGIPTYCDRQHQFNEGYQYGLKANETSPKIQTQGCPPSMLSTLRQAHQAGLETGLADYCSPEHAYLLAANGEPMADFCQGEMLGLIKDAYAEGNQLHTLYQQRQSTMMAMNKKAQLIKRSTDNDQLIVLYQAELKQLTQELSRINTLIDSHKRPYHIDIYDDNVRLEEDTPRWYRN